MALQFNPPPYVPPQPERDPMQEYLNPTLQLIQGLKQYKSSQEDDAYRKFQMQMARAKEAREQGEYAYKYGDGSGPVTSGGFPEADPRLSLYQPATAPGESQYGNYATSMETPSYAPYSPEAQPSIPKLGAGISSPGGLVERFRQWQKDRTAAPGQAGPDYSQPLTDEQLFAPGFGSERRADYLKTRKSRLEEQDLDRKIGLTQAEIDLKKAQTGYYGRRPGGASGRFAGVTYRDLVANRNQLVRQKESAIPGSDEEQTILGQIQELDDELKMRRSNPTGGTGTPAPTPTGGDGSEAPPAPRRNPIIKKPKTYTSPEEVKAAVRAGTLPRAEGIKILQTQFHFQ